MGGGLRQGPWLLQQHPFPAQNSNSFSGAPLHPQFSPQVCTCCDCAQGTPPPIATTSPPWWGEQMAQW